MAGHLGWVIDTRTRTMKTPLRLLSLVFAFAFALPLVGRAADYTVTAASVVPSTDASLARGTAGTTITAGMALAKDSNSLLQPYDANSGTAQLRVLVGIACGGAASGQPVVYCTQDLTGFTPGFSVAAGVIVIGSATPGLLCPSGDLATGHYLTIVGVGIGSNKIKFSTLAAGVATP